VNDLFIGLLSAMMATNQPAAVSNLIQQKTGLAVPIADLNDPVSRELQKIMAEDDSAQAEVDQWIKDAQQSTGQNNLAGDTLKARIKQRLAPVRKSYENFLSTHPRNAKALLAYGSFLNDIGEEHFAEQQWEKAREADPKDPATWNNLANFYGHNGNVTKAFEYYAKAIELQPDEPIYYQNFATTVFLFRRDATNDFRLTEAEVFTKSLDLYRKALELDPDNFLLATDYAQSYYAIKPEPAADAEGQRQAQRKLADEAIAAWRQALRHAPGETEREGIFVHFARWQINSGRFDEARQMLNAVTNGVYDMNKKALLKKIANRESATAPTNALPPRTEKPASSTRP
jgi:pentatricopeptide repeat protein